jgi:arylsulfatase A-like enzyme
MSFNAIHDPLMESRDRISQFRQLPQASEPENHAVVAAMLERMDDNIGRVLSKIEELGLTEETLIIFFSDNGGKASYADQSPFRKGKGWLYEGGIRVPLVIKWKGKIPENKISDEIVISNDLFPTLATVINKSTSVSHDGIDLWGHITNGEKLPGRDIFWHYPHYHRGSGMVPASAVRSGDFKLIEWFEGSLLQNGNALELYNLKNDPGESINLADSLLYMKDSLYKELQNWRENVDAGLPAVK